MRDSRNRIRTTYARLVARHGRSHRAVDWGSASSQRLRLRVLTEIGALEGASILDVGCGLGDLYALLQEEGLAVDYHGIDLTPEMTAAVRERFPGIRVDTAHLLDLDPEARRYDFVLASGIFYLLEDVREAWALIEHMYRLAMRGVGFNSLSTWGPAPQDELVLDPLHTADRCRRLTSALVLRHDYLPHDFTIYLYGNAR